MKYFLITIILICGSCNRDTSYSHQVELPAVSDTLIASVNLFDDDIANIHDMLNVCDRYLVLVDKVKSPYFRVFDSNSGKELYKWGEKGDGPNEFNDFPFYGILNNYDFNDCRLEVFSSPLGQVLTYIVNDSTLVEVDKFKVDYNNRKTFFNHINNIHDGMYSILYDMDTKNKRHLMISRYSLEPLFAFGNFDNIEEGKNLRDTAERQVLEQKYSKLNMVSRDRKLFFSFNQKQNVLDIYHTHDGSVVKNVSIIDNYFPVENHDRKDVLFRALIFTGADKVYAIGMYNEIEKLLDIGLDNVTAYLEEWNLDGTPSRRFLIDKPFEKAVVIGDKLYGFSSTYGNQYYVYTIPK